jgi:hypothetical protein
MRVFVDMATHAQYVIGGTSPHILEVGTTPDFLGDVLDSGATVAVARESLVTFSVAHGLSSGDPIVITNVTTTPDVTSQVFPVKVVSTTAVTIPVNVTVGDLTGAGIIYSPLKTPINGRYIIPVIEGTDILVDENSYVFGSVTPIDGGDISSENFAGLLARFPMYSNIHFNPLLLGSHVTELDLTATFRDNSVAPPNYFPTRAQTGTAGTAVAPNSTAILPANVHGAGFTRPGVLITDLIDLTALTPLGADEFLVYWKIHQIHSSHDVAGSGLGVTDGVNTPAIRSIVEIEQEPSWFSVYLTIDNGINWQQVTRLVPESFCCLAPNIRLAFVNNSPSKVCLTNYAVIW